MKTVFVGLSGGVDSSVSAALLKDQGYHVVGVYMKNWSRDLPGMECPWAEDLADAKRVAVKLGIDFLIFDFEAEYKNKVVDYMLSEFKKGHTPNPDIMCNQEIKFKLFYEISREKGADFIATGHYARTDGKNLLRAKDDNKDQTYFLYRISKDAIKHTLFPVGDMYKPDVKKLAEKYGLHNAYKKESMGVCFVGEVGMKDFLRQYFEETPGPIKDAETGEILGYHEGAIFYTIGQRHGLEIGGGLPYYVVKKDIKNNIVYVSKNLNSTDLWTRELELEDVIWRGDLRTAFAAHPAGYGRGIAAEPHDDGREDRGDAKDSRQIAYVRLRHRAELIPCTLLGNKLIFKDKIKRPASGQSAVLYGGEDAKICLGGGIIK